MQKTNMPPLPWDPYPELPVYYLGGNTFAVDDRMVDYEALSEQRALDRALRALETEYGILSSYVPGPPGWEEGDPDQEPFPNLGPAYAYDTNAFWLEILWLTNGVAGLRVHGTAEDELYEIFSKESLQAVPWLLETNLWGASDQNWTDAAIPVGDRTNALFFWARSWVDSDGSGMPDWWQIAWFGHTGVDPYGDDDNDGWVNIQEYQNGTNPLDPNTPPPPRNVRAVLAPNGTSVLLSWESGGGAVVNFEVRRTTTEDVVTLNPSQTSWEEPNADYMRTDYLVTAFYGGTTRVSGASVRVPRPELDATLNVVRGPQGEQFLVMAPVPANFSDVVLTWYTWEGEPIDVSVSATNFVNGVAPMPSAPEETYDTIDYQVFTLAGEMSEWGVGRDWSWLRNQERFPSQVCFDGFADVRQHMKENLRFLLRSATITRPFSYGSDQMTDGGILLEAEPAGMWVPENYFARPPSSTDYEYSGFRVFSSNLNYSVMQELRPVHENHLWRNFMVNADDLAATNFPSGPGTDFYGADPTRLLDWPQYFYEGTGEESPIAVPLINSDPSFLFYRYVHWSWWDFDTAQEIGVYSTGGGLPLNLGTMPNIYGLPLQGLVVNSPVQEISPGGQFSPMSGETDFYPNFAIPDFETVGYYFASQTPSLRFGATFPPVPGSPDFTVTNESPPLIMGIEDWISVGGWAKLAITNGYANKFGYLEQLFEAALVIDGSGAVTTDSAGIISPYGEFLPTIAGPAALVTMPDIDTGERGTGIVHVIKLQLDVNHDGAMDLTSAGQDNTSAGNPYVFWVNNDYDRVSKDIDDNAWYEDSVSAGEGKNTPDCNYNDHTGARVIPTRRDLQDFARLWVCGVTSNLRTALPPGTVITLDWGDFGNPDPANPTIDLFPACESNGEIGYLTNSGDAVLQTAPALYPFIGRLGPGQRFQLNSDQFTNAWAGNHFIWCGVSNGIGTLTLTITQGSNTLAQTTAYIQLVNIKQMYERWTVGDNPSKPPLTNAVIAVEDLKDIGGFEYPESTDTNTPCILFVHGWNMKRWEKDRFAESAFKRLYWQGYQGRFGLFRWPTDHGFVSGIWDGWRNPVTDFHNYDRSELTAWRSGTGLLNKLSDLNVTYPGRVYMLAHSMGNVVAGEALRLAGTNQLVNTYIASQAAIPAHIYDSTSTNLIDFSHKNPKYPPSPANFGPSTPNIYGDWLVGNSAGAGRRINFYNANDFALSPDGWCFNQELKPDDFASGSYTYFGSTNDPAPWNHFAFVPTFGSILELDIVADINELYEAMAYAAESYSKALGATPGITALDQTLDLTTIWPSPDPLNNTYRSHFWHSAQFRGQCWQQWNYWNTLVRSASQGFDIQNP